MIVIIKVYNTNFIILKGSTLVIMQSNKEPNSFFGGMAVSSWNSQGKYISDPTTKEFSWLFKIEVGEKK